MYDCVEQIAQKSRSHLKILGARGVLVGPQVLGATHKI